jgi:predicted secreted hydrolase
MLHRAKRRAVFLCSLVLIASSFFGLAWRAAALLPTAKGAAANDKAGFHLALPGYEYSFPRDHGSHPPYQTEWWYFTGHLESVRSAKKFGYELTFFRRALIPELKNRRSKWATRDIILAHLALTDESGRRFYFSDRASRAALGLAGAQTAQLSRNPRIWLNDWNTQFFDSEGKEQHIAARGTDERSSTPFSVQLAQRALKKPVVHGENGVSQKADGRGQASHYYSLTRIATKGKDEVAGETYQVTGESWFDHEFGSNQLAANQAGWDWFSIQLGDGRELMLYQLRLKNGAVDAHSSGTLVEKDGRSQHLRRDDFQIEVTGWWQSPHSRAKYPAGWEIRLPKQSIELRVEPTLADQELDTKHSTGITYWEGSVSVRGAQHARALTGRGYVELTGYARQFNGVF